MSRIVVMGSGETAPTMVKVHREVFAACPPGPAVMLDTPFAFQMNRDELVTKTRAYFAQSVGRDVDVAVWSGTEGPAQEEKSLALLDRAAWAFAGPGSPTYALRRWRGTRVPAALAGVVRRGGTVVLGSAAAVTLGSHAVPVYEIYKVGADPSWADGLDLLGELTGVAAAVVPHYDNKEGATHDTRYCYLGEERLALLEESLPDEVGVLGVDEHTALVVDVEARTMTVSGNGLVSVRRRGTTTTFAAGESLGLDELSALLRGERAAAASGAVGGVPEKSAEPQATGEPALSLRAEADRARTAFEAALAARDADGCVAAVLGLEQAIADWQGDTLQSDDADEARRVLRALVVRLGELAERGAADPAVGVAPFVEALIDVRRAARDNKDFGTSDLVRDRLVAAGVEVRDTPDGTEWTLSLVTGRPDPVEYLGEVARSTQGRDYKAAVLESLQLGPEQVVLDVGCGPGTDLAAMAGFVAPDGVVIGVDHDERMVNEAAQRTADLIGVEVRRGDAHALPLADASVDRARTDRVLQHVADPVAAVADIARVLRPGGLVVFAEPDWGTLVVDAGDEIGRSVSRAFVRWTCEQVVRNATVGRSLARHASGAGLSVRAVSAYPSVWTSFETADRVLGLTRNSASAVEGGYVEGADRDAWLAGLAAGPVVAAVSLFVVVAVRPVAPV